MPLKPNMRCFACFPAAGVCLHLHQGLPQLDHSPARGAALLYTLDVHPHTRQVCVFQSHRPLPLQEFMKVVLEFLDRPEGAECTVGMTEGVFSKEGFGTDSHRNRPFDRKKKAT